MSIEVREISKTFGAFKALRNVSVQVPSGELVALLGPSGSGKTTLLRIVAGLETPDAGSGPIFFDEEDVAKRRVGDRHVGFVFQHYALFRHMTVFENVAFGLRVRPRKLRPPEPTIRRKVVSLLRLVQLQALAHRYPHQLSGGQRQRIALARALAVEPRVLLLDEPFGALDAKVRQELRHWLRRLHDEIHLTSVFVTHDQDEALELADRVAVMNQGRIEQYGTPNEVFHHPKTEFVMNFLGNVNQFRGRLVQGKVRFADMEIDAPGHNGNQGEHAAVFIRPHDLEIATEQNGHPSSAASVARIHSAGATVRLELISCSGERLAAELTHQRFEELSLTQGDKVFVTPRTVRVFGQDYVVQRRV
jgi:sulfate/thiosulfate transport system ATP-binding protein